MTDVMVKPQEEQEIKEKVSTVLARVEAVSILNSDDEILATDLLKDIAEAGKMIEAKKKSITDPMNQALKSARSFFAPFEDNIEQAKTLLKSKIMAFKTAMMKRAAEEQAKIEQKVEAGKMKFETAEKKIANITQPEDTVKGERGTTIMRKVKKIVITDKTKIPMQYWELNEPMIRRDALAGVEIPGVKVTEEDQLAIR